MVVRKRTTRRVVIIDKDSWANFDVKDGPEANNILKSVYRGERSCLKNYMLNCPENNG